MSTSKHAFDQVKSILGKLDRSIDAARARRLDNSRPPVAPVQHQPAAPIEPPAQAKPLRATPAFSSGLGNGAHGPVFQRRDRA